MKKIIASVILLGLAFPAYSTEVKIMHTSDIHGRIFPITYNGVSNVGGLSRKVQLFNNVKNTYDNVLIFDAGDYFQGSLYNTLFKGKPDSKLLKYSNYDAMTFGNHEFDNGLKPLVKLVKNSKTPYISTNLKFDNEYLSKKVMPYKVVDIQGDKILILGVTTPDLPSLTNANGITILDTVQEVRKYINTIPHSSVIVISHLGVDGDKKLLNSVPEIDLILGGHDHVYCCTNENCDEIIHTGEFGVKISDIIFDTKKGVIKAGYKDIYPTLESSKTVDKKLQPYYLKAQKKLDIPLATSYVELIGDKETMHKQQTNLGRLVLYAAASKFPDYDAVIINSGSIRLGRNIKGTITKADVLEILPFNNKIVYGEIDGKSLKEIISKGSVAGRGYLQYIVKPEFIDDYKFYKVVTSDYIAAGGDKYSEFKNMKITSKTKENQSKIMMDYLQNIKNIKSSDVQVNLKTIDTL